jgi:hypothetical protein
MSKLTNEYDRLLEDVFDDIPKAVLAAIAVSGLTCGGDRATVEYVKYIVTTEWQILHNSGIVPQAPVGSVKQYVDMDRYNN